MKKILATVLGVIFAMFAFAGCNMAAADGTTTGASGITSIVMMVVIIAVFYFLMIVPEKKRKKKAQEMRDSIEVGDNALSQRTHGADAGRFFALHLASFFTHGNQFAGDRVECHNRWLIYHNLIVVNDEGIGCT